MSGVICRSQWPAYLLKPSFKRFNPYTPAFASKLNHIDQRRFLSIEKLDNRRSGRERVIVLGSGWGGFNVARGLDPKLYQTIVVSPRSYFAFTPLLASTAVGTLEFRTALEPIRSRRNKVEFLQGWADNVDLANKTLSVEENVDDPRQSLAPTADKHSDLGKAERIEQEKEEVRKSQLFSLSWDKLVVTVGCYSQTFGTPGVRENAYFLKDIGDARRIRTRLLQCFEAAALPTTTSEMRSHLLNFAIVGGGPTGIEFSGELRDFIYEDLSKLYPDLIPHVSISVYDVSDKVLPMFDAKLGEYAMKHLAREKVNILTSHHITGLRTGAPKITEKQSRSRAEAHDIYTLVTEEEGEIGVGMCVWSTGLMMNPFVAQRLDGVQQLPAPELSFQLREVDPSVAESTQWEVWKDPKSGGIMTDDKLRMLMKVNGIKPETDPRRAVLRDVFALGDCAVMEGSMYPATAQVAQQKADWLAKRLNKQDIDRQAGFHWKNMGVMAYLGNWNAILQSSGTEISGRMAWIVWRGAYLTKSVSWRNKILIPVYWVINWLFGRDVTRF